MISPITREAFIRDLTQAILKMDDLDRFLNLLTEMSTQIFGVKWATLSLLNEASGQYSLKATFRNAEEPGEVGHIDNPDAWLKDRQRIVSSRLLDEFGPRMAPELREELNKTDTFISLPLYAGEQLIGILNLGPKETSEAFNEKDVKTISELTGLMSTVIYQAVGYHNAKEQNLHNRNIIDNLVSGIIAIDPEDKITVFNRAAERILKYSADQVLGKDIRMLQANLGTLLLDTLHQGKSYRREELYILPENTLIGVSTSQFYNSKGRLLGACMVFSSLAEIKKQQITNQQQNLNAYWSNVANSLAHEVKNSIMATKVYTEMFPQKYEDAEFRWSLYATLKRDMEKLDEFSEKMLDYAETQQMLIQPCQMDKVMDAAINSAFQEKNVREITFEKRYGSNLKAIPGDYHKLKEAFGHIIRNALEAMGKTGKLTISIEQESGPEMLTYNLPEMVKQLPQTEIMVVKITDTGCGISPESMPYLFDPFFTTKTARTGLGLASARKIIAKHKGIIKAESKAGEGATFWVCLPNFLESWQQG